MTGLCRLLSPRLLGFRNILKGAAPGARKRGWVMGIIGIGFWVGMFALSARVLIYFQSVEVIGDLLAHHLLAMILLTFFSLLIFSHIITALSNLYLSSDLDICHASPVSLETVFLSRGLLTVVDSSWMVAVFGLPVMMAYAYVYRPGPLFYLSLLHTGAALILIAAAVGILFTMTLVRIFPAHRTRDIIMLMVIFLVVALYLLFRFLRPERLVDPDAFFTIMQYLGALKGPDSPYLPTHWATEILWSHLAGTRGGNSLFFTALLWSTVGAWVVINVWTAQRIYFDGFSRAQEARRRKMGGNLFFRVLQSIFTRPFGQDLASLLDKDIRTFFRDNTQWSQLILLGALVVVYLYNFSVLPLERSPIRLEFLQNEIAFLNLGLAGFVLSAISVRFIFPAVSAEGRAFWIIQSSPVSIRRFLRGKFISYLPPMILLGEILIVVTNHILRVTPFMMALLSLTMFLSVFGIVALAVGFGAVYPNFKHENIAQVATGFGGVIYMMVATLFMILLILLEAGPVYMIFMAGVKERALTFLQWAFIIPSFALVLLVNALAVYLPLKKGVTALSRYE